MIYIGTGEMKDPANYRDVSLLSPLSKIYIWVLAMTMNEWIEMRCIISAFHITFIVGLQWSDWVKRVPILLYIYSFYIPCSFNIIALK